ncbi:hypothetical protein BGW36DRAFT_323070 [Talaromyces proteolyticus]|uniref:dihydroneopterin aldolase n=1 Tax=Talaromyces proteolyticus TaxID=1131652 RepID=A0AAD4PWQ8_9EURO|nr:uncharacterized protein BGW36DRAFT_323070 [Talaromyces proteolyticus]KAH8695365.1 hypothetical protein BGW36DRAFT_323070 [Talaromyces proteolyticus]
MASNNNLSPAPRPAIVDHVLLQDANLHLPAGPDPWHRPGKAQPCTVSVKLSYSSAIAAATADDVSLSIDYGKLYRRIETDIQNAGKNPPPDLTDSERARRTDILLGHDVRIIAGLITDCGLGLLDETIAGVRRMAHVHPSSPTRRRASQASRRMSGGSSAGYAHPDSVGSEALDPTFGECEVSVHLPNAHLRAEGGLKFRSMSTWGYDRAYGSTEDAVESGRQVLVVEQEFRIEGIRCYCILGVNSHERIEKQCVNITLAFRGSGEPAWSATVVDTYQEMVKVVAERVENTSYQTVEALATFIARIATLDFGNHTVTVSVKKPSALAFVENAGVEITRSQAFFAQQDFLRRKEGREPYS